MTYKKQKGINPIGSVICFVVYVILCGQIITLIESQWLIVPAGLQAIVNRQNVDGQTIKVKSNSTAVGSCGLVGMCYPFHTGSILAEDLAVKFEKCRLYNNKVELGGQAGLIAISLYGVGLGFLTLSWIISICSCCHDNICGKNIFLVLTHFITLAFVMVGSGSVTWMFTWHDESCASVYCNATPLFKNNCLFGWSLWVLSAVIIALFCTMIALCAITKRHLSAVGPKIRRIPIQVAERPGNNTGFMFAMVSNSRGGEQSRGPPQVEPVGLQTRNSAASERSTARFPRGGPGVYGSVRLKEFYF